MIERIGPALRRFRWWLVGAVAIATVLFVFLTWQWMISPSTVEPDRVGPVDAVVLFVGGRGERLETALELMDLRVAPTLVIPNGTARGWPRGNRLCRNQRPFEVLCPTPDPVTTRGEARLIAQLAEDRGWSSVAMVTSTYHVDRARVWLRHCYDGDITAVAAPVTLSKVDWLKRLSHEWPGQLQARVLERSC